MDFPQYTEYRPVSPVMSDPSPRQQMPTVRVGDELAPRSGTRLASGVAHLSVFMFSFFGPLLFWACSRPGTATRRESAKAFNQTSILAAATAGGVAVLESTPFVNLWFFAGFTLWVLLSIIGAVHAFHGEDVDEPVTRRLPWRPLRDGDPRARG